MNPFSCPSCNYANETNRVFCQSCGMRLFKNDATAETPKKKKKGKSDVTENSTPRRGRTLKAPMSRDEIKERIEKTRPPFSWYVFFLLRTAIIAALLAVVIQMLRKPDGVPDAVATFTETRSERLEMDIISQREEPTARIFPISFSDANGFLAQRIAVVPSGVVRYVRCYIAPVGNSDNKFYLGSEQKIGTLPIFVQTRFAVSRDERNMNTTAEAMSIGRLPIPSFAVAFLAAKTLDRTIETIGKPIECLRDASSIKISREEIKAIWSAPSNNTRR